MFFVVKVNQFQGSADRPATTDKNGFAPVILSSHNGTLPERSRVISGTVAQRAGLQVGKNYAVKVTETHVDPVYGPQYQIDVVGEVTTLELITNVFKPGVVQKTTTDDKKANAAKIAAGVDEDDEDDDKNF